MKSYNQLYTEVCSFTNLWRASRNARKGKRGKTNVALFETGLENELCALREELLSHTYRPGSYTEFFVYEPKKRMISAAPYRDRVVHHALCNVIEPLFDRKFIFDSYANRRGKGSHKAILRYQEFCRRNRYVLKCDVRKFFPSIDHEILKSEIRRTISCPGTLWIIDTILEHSNAQEAVLDYYPGDDLFTPLVRRKGLPIGNLTSQFFANVYLNPLDHYVKEVLRCHAYLRYADDLIVFADDKGYLHNVKAAINEFLSGLRLATHVGKTRAYRVADGVEFLGFRIFPQFRLLKRENVIRTRRRLRRLQAAYGSGNIGLATVRASIQGWIGHARWADSYRLRTRMLGEAVFRRE